MLSFRSESVLRGRNAGFWRVYTNVAQRQRQIAHWQPHLATSGRCFTPRSESTNLGEYLLRMPRGCVRIWCIKGNMRPGWWEGGMVESAFDGSGSLASEVFNRFRSASASVPSLFSFLAGHSVVPAVCLQSADCFSLRKRGVSANFLGNV